MLCGAVRDLPLLGGREARITQRRPNQVEVGDAEGMVGVQHQVVRAKRLRGGTDRRSVVRDDIDEQFPHVLAKRPPQQGGARVGGRLPGLDAAGRIREGSPQVGGHHLERGERLECASQMRRVAATVVSKMNP